MKNLYHLVFQEINGERSYQHDLLFAAENDADANRTAHERMKCFFPRPAKENDQCAGEGYEFDGGQLGIKQSVVTQVTRAEIARLAVDKMNYDGVDIQNWNWYTL